MILHLNNAKTWRGGEQQLYYLATGLAKKNIPQIVIGKPGSELESRLKDKVEFIPVNMKNEYDLFSVWKIKKICEEREVKLIHTHTANSHSIGLLTKLFLPKLFLLVSRRVDFPISKNPLSKRKYLSEKVDYFLCVSNKIKEVLYKDGVNPKKLLTVHSGIDLEKFPNHQTEIDIRNEHGISEDTILIGNVAALVDHKDQATLIRAIPMIKTKNKFMFMIIGEGELEQDLKYLAKELRVEDKIIFTGYKKNILDYYKAMNIFTLTSKEEGLGTSILDAMSASLPIIATRGGGIAEMLEKNSGSFLENIGDYTSLTKDFIKLIESEKLRKEFGKLNKEKVKEFSVENTIEKTLQIYNSLLRTTK